MKETRIFTLKEFGHAFATREKARMVFSHLEKMLQGQPTQLIVDWTGVNAASPSFIDELIGLLWSNETKGLTPEDITFTSAKPYTTELINKMLHQRNCRLQYAISIEAAQAGETRTLGDVPTQQPSPVR